MHCNQQTRHASEATAHQHAVRSLSDAVAQSPGVRAEVAAELRKEQELARQREKASAAVELAHTDTDTDGDGDGSHSGSEGRGSGRGGDSSSSSSSSSSGSDSDSGSGSESSQDEGFVGEPRQDHQSPSLEPKTMDVFLRCANCDREVPLELLDVHSERCATDALCGRSALLLRESVGSPAVRRASASGQQLDLVPQDCVIC